MVCPLRVGDFGHKQGSNIEAEERNSQKKCNERGVKLLKSYKYIKHTYHSWLKSEKISFVFLQNNYLCCFLPLR